MSSANMPAEMNRGHYISIVTIVAELIKAGTVDVNNGISAVVFASAQLLPYTVYRELIWRVTVLKSIYNDALDQAHAERKEKHEQAAG